MIKVTVNFMRYVIMILTFNIYALMVDSGILVWCYVGVWKIKTILEIINIRIEFYVKKNRGGGGKINMLVFMT